MSSPAPSLVHTKETNRPSGTYRTYGECLRDSCLDQYEAAEAVYAHLDQLNETSKRFDLENCRSSAWFVRNIESGSVRVASKTCRLRWCPVCSDSKRAYISHSVADWVRQQEHPKFLTLTLKHSNAPLSHQIDILYRGFRSLRKRKDFRDSVPGGFWFFQIRRSKSDGQWHPHLHCIISGLYIPHSRMSRMWLQITSTSAIVDIRAIRDPAKASNDAARYAACPGSLAGLPFDSALELVESMHGRRICGTWGTARSVSLRPPVVADKELWKNIGGWNTVMSIKSTNPIALAIFNAWQNNDSLDATFDLCHKDPSPFKSYIIDVDDYALDSMYPPERSPP